MKEPAEQPRSRWTEEIEVAAGDLVATVKRLVAQGNVRRLIIRSGEDRTLLELPLTAGVVIGGTLALLSPLLAALGALAALLSRVRIVIVRERDD